MSDRATWDETWMELAEVMGRRTRCFRGVIGCVLVDKNNVVVSTGYAGPPANFQPAQVDETTDCRSWCPRGPKTDPSTLDPGWADCVSCHAEQNAVSRADFSLLKGGTAYVNAACCINCSKLLAAAQVARVVMKIGAGETHRQPQRSIDYLEQAGITVTVVERT